MRKQRRSFLKGGLIAIIAFAMFLPAMLDAGSLQPPSGTPAPTMKTLEQIPPTWSEKITTGRFVDALDGAAVLDKETGLVWEKSPSTSTLTWTDALNCVARPGWHLPTIEQLASLIDTSVSGSLKLPSGHPFTGVQSGSYWSANTYPADTTDAWVVYFSLGVVGVAGKTSDRYKWCVRGGQSIDAY